MKTTSIGIICVCLFLFFSFSGVYFAEMGSENTIHLYVSTAGQDIWSGGLDAPNPDKTDGPFATLEKARDAIRQLKAEKKLNRPVVVSIRAGVYTLQKPFTLTPEDSGTETCPITYAAFPGENPIISGGKPIRGWKKGPGEFWTAALADDEKGEWKFNQLFVNGERRTRARTPNDGFFHIEGPSSQDHPFQLKFKKGDVKKEWAEKGDVEVIALLSWAELRMPIVSVDEETCVAVLAGNPQPSNREKDARYYVENTLDALDSPGEWYLDKQNGVVTYWPLPGEDMATVEVIAPTIPQLLLFAGQPAEKQFVRYVSLQDLTFRHTSWTLPPKGYADVQAAYDIPATIAGNGVVECRIERCLFQHLGNYAIELARGCKTNHIVGNVMTDLGAGGVKIGEPAIRNEEQDVTRNNRITDNHIHDIGVVYPAAIGVWIAQSGGNHVAHNEINDTFYSGISVGWTWGYSKTNAHDNLIEFNHVHHIGRYMLSDMGGIYTLGVQPGTVIRNNCFHDIHSYGYGGWGIYPDEGSTDILIEKNVVYNTKSAGFHQHYGRENIVRNNIFAFGAENQLMRSRMEDHISFTFEHNIVLWREGKLLGSNWKDDKYKMDYNLYFDMRGEDFNFAQWTWKEWRERGQDVHSLIADPLFENANEYNFTLQPNSPAHKIEFEAIDLGSVGPRQECIRK
ncbi:MAG: right-handed parallel beta-helix repeat-containing protein [Candidatus Omnitrophota bacterium]|nr:MAG: right-handed parallel beta-helix repeat-containing protein [Candidatus Omnitrophota bacterium]